MTLVKICGICSVEDAVATAAAGADLLGFHFCPSRRRVSTDAAVAMVKALDARRPQLVGVFIDPSEDLVREVSRDVGLDLVQLHGSESPAFAASRPVLKALKVREGEVPDPAAWPDPLLLDSWTADSRGGSGEAWDWSAGRELIARRRVFLAGGLTPANVGAAVRQLRPYGVDVSSGVERDVRRKDPDLVRAFLQAVRDADAEG